MKYPAELLQTVSKTSKKNLFFPPQTTRFILFPCHCPSKRRRTMNYFFSRRARIDKSIFWSSFPLHSSHAQQWERRRRRYKKADKSRSRDLWLDVLAMRGIRLDMKLWRFVFYPFKDFSSSKLMKAG